MRFPMLLLLAGLLATTAYAEDTAGTDATPSTGNPATTYDRTAMRYQVQQRRDAWRAMTPEQRQAQLQSGRSQAQSLRKQRNVQ